MRVCPLIVIFFLSLFLVSTVEAVPVGELRKGIAARDHASGQGYILFVPGGLNPEGFHIDVPGGGESQGRFLVYSSNAKNFVAVQFVNGSWHYDDNSYLRPFVPQASDTIVASVDFTADTVTMLNGQDTVVHGIRAGYQQGDINITANMWDGVANNGEFGVTGTNIDLNPLPVVPDAVNIPLSQKPWVIDNGSGIAYAEGKNDEGTAYSFRFLSQRGINYVIESSEDLQTWQNVGFYHGLGLTINHPLFPLIQNENGEAVIEATPEEYTPPINASLRIAEIKSGTTTTGLHLSWLSMDDGTPMNYTLHGQTLETGVPALYSKQFDDYVFFIQFSLGGVNAPDVPTPDTLRPNDAAMIGKFMDSLPTINAEIAASTAAQSANPSPPPASGSKTFYRIVRKYADSDGDTILDHIEVANGTDHYNWDSDGDGISDSNDSNPNENAAMADPDGSGLSASLLNGLMGRWDFEQVNAQGNYPDKSPNSNHAQVVSGDLQKLGIISRAFSLIPNTTTQAGNHLTMAASSMGSVYSLSMWIKPEKNNLNGLNHQVLWSYQSTDNTTNLRLVLTSGKTMILRRKIQGQPLVHVASWTLTDPVNLGKWHHISLVRKAYSVPSISGYLHELYFDGKKIPLGQSTTPVEQDTLSAGSMAMGKDITSAPSAGATGEGDYFGLVDRLLFHNRALTAAEILSLFQNDADQDGLWDVSESRSYIWRDNDGDGEEDSEEITYTINPFRWDRPDLDHDDDGILSLAEQNHTTNPTDIAHPDTDGDLIPDGWELDNGLDPNDENDALIDGDNDGANNLVEYSFNSNPNKADTDGDGTSDGDEAGGPDGDPDTPGGSNPNDPGDNGQPLPPEEKLVINLGVGDKSGSLSEDYVMNIYRIDPDTGSKKRFYTLRSGGHGQYKEITLDIFKKRDTYTFQIDWQSSNLGTSSSGTEGPDYDYWFVVEPQNDETGILIDQYDPEVTRVDPSKPIGGRDKNDVEDFPQSVEKKRVLRLKLEINSDLNNDGEIDIIDELARELSLGASATDEQKEKGTEYLFTDDKISNGLMDKDDPKAPAGTTDDDDTQEIKISVGVKVGIVRFDHPAINKLKFYEDRGCTKEIVFPRALGTKGIPKKLYIRAEGEFTKEEEGLLVLKYKAKVEEAEVDASKMRLTIVHRVGDKKYFHATRDYMKEMNSKLCVRRETTVRHGRDRYWRLVSMLHEKTRMITVDSFHRTPKLKGIEAVVGSFGGYDIAVNGNFCYKNDGIGPTNRPESGGMTDRCHGQFVSGGIKRFFGTIGGSVAYEKATAEYIGYNIQNGIDIRTGYVPTNPIVHDEVLGGFASDLDGSIGDYRYGNHPWFGIGKAGDKKVFFIATPFTNYEPGGGNPEDIKKRLKDSGCPALPGGQAGEIQCVAGDGGSSLALAYRLEGEAMKVRMAGSKHFQNNNRLPQQGDYFINTYLLFSTQKTR